MLQEFEIFFDNKNQVHLKYLPLSEVIDALFVYLRNKITKKEEVDTKVIGSVLVVSNSQYDTIDPDTLLSVCTPTLAKTILENKKEIELYASTNVTGIFSTAKAKLFTVESTMSASSFKTADQINEMVTSEADHDNLKPWKDIDLTPKDIIRNCELTLFRNRLKYYMTKSRWRHAGVDRMAGFNVGVTESLLDPFKMITPDLDMVFKLASVFHVQPHELWVDLLPSYMEIATNSKKTKLDSRQLSCPADNAHTLIK